MENEKLQDDPVADAVKSIMTDEQETPTVDAEPQDAENEQAETKID